MKKIWDLSKTAFSSWLADYASSMGAALAYYTMFSIAPLLLIVISIAGLVFGADASRGEIFDQIKGLMGEQGAQALQGLLISVNQSGKGITATVISAVILIVGATTVFGELQDDLDRIWRAPARKGSGLWSLLRARLLSFGMILGIAFLLLVSLVSSAAIAALGHWWGAWLTGWEVLAHGINLVLSFALTTAVFALIYKIMPRVQIRWHDVWIGAAITALLFTVGKFLIGLYIGKSGVASGFGAAGSLVVVLVWVYYSAQIFLLGAEFTWAYSNTYGSRKDKPPAAEKPVLLDSKARPAQKADTATLEAGKTSRSAAGNSAQPTSPQSAPAQKPRQKAKVAKLPVRNKASTDRARPDDGSPNRRS